MVGVDKPHFAVLLVVLMLVASMTACSLNSPEMLNDGRGTRDNPIPARMYARTSQYDVRVLSVVMPQTEEATESEKRPIRVQYQIHCTKSTEDVCRLQDIGRNIKLVDASGILYDPIFSRTVEEPLEGEILGDAEQAGWLVYEIPNGIELAAAVSEYGDDQRVFFELPR